MDASPDRRHAMIRLLRLLRTRRESLHPADPCDTERHSIGFMASLRRIVEFGRALRGTYQLNDERRDYLVETRARYTKDAEDKPHHATTRALQCHIIDLLLENRCVSLAELRTRIAEDPQLQSLSENDQEQEFVHFMNVLTLRNVLLQE